MIQALNLVFQFGGLSVATEQSYAAAFGVADANATSSPVIQPNCAVMVARVEQLPPGPRASKNEAEVTSAVITQAGADTQASDKLTEAPAEARRAWARHPWWVLTIALTVLVAFGLGIGLSLYQAATAGPLMEQANALPPGDTRIVIQREVVQFQADNLAKIWTTIVQALGAVVLAIGGYFTWRNLRVTQQTLEATQAKLRLEEEGQITDRFTQAITQLGAEYSKDGSPNLEARLGGIFALEKIVQDAPQKYHWTVTEVLTAYVRQNAPWRPAAPTESRAGWICRGLISLEHSSGGPIWSGQPSETPTWTMPTYGRHASRAPNWRAQTSSVPT